MKAESHRPWLWPLVASIVAGVVFLPSCGHPGDKGGSDKGVSPALMLLWSLR